MSLFLTVPAVTKENVSMEFLNVLAGKKLGRALIQYAEVKMYDITVRLTF